MKKQISKTKDGTTLTVIHQYMREMIVNLGEMSIVSAFSGKLQYETINNLKPVGILGSGLDRDSDIILDKIVEKTKYIELANRKDFSNKYIKNIGFN